MNPQFVISTIAACLVAISLWKQIMELNYLLWPTDDQLEDEEDETIYLEIFFRCVTIVALAFTCSACIKLAIQSWQ